MTCVFELEHRRVHRRGTPTQKGYPDKNLHLKKGREDNVRHMACSRLVHGNRHRGPARCCYLEEKDHIKPRYKKGFGIPQQIRTR